MWEACWTNYLTDYFHLFLCLAIISIYSDDVIAQDLRTDEMLLHFSSLAMFMDGELILRKVNILFDIFNFNNMYVIPPNIPDKWNSVVYPIQCFYKNSDMHFTLSSLSKELLHILVKTHLNVLPVPSRSIKNPGYFIS